MKRVLGLALVGVLAGACGPEPARSGAAPVAPEIEAPTAELLPAGIYWRGYQVCEACPAPAFATAINAADVDEARALVAAAPAGLPLGYPMVVHANQLGLPAGVLVVYGLHADQAGADAWLAHQKRLGLATARLAIAGDEQPPLLENPSVVSRLIAGGKVRAYARDAVIAAETAAYKADRWPEPEAIAAELTPACELEAGALFVVPQTELEWYRWAPVRCGETAALVPWRQSMLGSATVIRRRGGFVLRQITAVDCDMPTFSEWGYSAEGKSGEPLTQTTGDC